MGYWSSRKWYSTCLIGLLIVLPVGAQPPSEFKLIVHPDSTASSIDETFVRNAFLKKATRWPNGDLIRPVDLREDSEVRKIFSQHVLRRPVNAIRIYWQQLIFSGRDVPPPELNDSAQVIDFVRTHPGALGYIPAQIDASGVRVLPLR